MNGPNLVTLENLARVLRLSKRGLRVEARSGRIPSLKAGQRRLFSVDAVKNVLSERASREGVTR